MNVCEIKEGDEYNSGTFYKLPTVTLYRVEDSDGNGPYCGVDYKKQELMGIKYHNYKDSIHLLPEEDTGRCMLPNEISAFDSLEQLHEWFTDRELELMSEHGYNIVEFQGIVTAYGNKQVIVRRL